MFQNPYAALLPPQQNQYYPQINNQQIPMQNEAQNLIRVNGIDGAKAYQMMPNSTVALFDANNDLMYIKSTDGAGFPAIRTFSFTEVKETQEAQSIEYISREEFENFKKELMQDGKQSLHRSKSNIADKSASD